jgi:hypothetical protein
MTWRSGRVVVLSPMAQSSTLPDLASLGRNILSYAPTCRIASTASSALFHTTNGGRDEAAAGVVSS